MGTVRTITRYPIKSLGGHLLDEGFVDATGLVGDRCFAFIDRETGELCTAKHPRRFAGLLACTARYVEPPRPGEPLPLLEVSFPDGAVAHNVGDELDEAMSQFLGRPVGLISSMPDTGLRTKIVYDESFGQDKGNAYASAVADEFGDEVVTYTKRRSEMGTFVDQAPLHLVTTSTLAHFAALDQEASFDARRYRPTMLLETAGSELVEEGWIGGSVRIGAHVEAAVAGPTARCIMSTIEHAPDVPLDRSTLRTIVQHNSQDLGAQGRWGCLGVYADVRVGGMVRVGDPVRYVLAPPESGNP